MKNGDSRFSRWAPPTCITLIFHVLHMYWNFVKRGGCLCLEWCHAKGSHMKPWRSMTRGVGGSKNPNLAWRNNWKAPFIILSFSINTIFSLAILFENKGSSFFHNDLFSLISHQDSHSIRVLHTCSVWFTNRFRCWRYLYKSASFLVFANIFFQSGTWHNCLPLCLWHMWLIVTSNDDSFEGRMFPMMCLIIV